MKLKLRFFAEVYRTLRLGHITIVYVFAAETVYTLEI